MQQMDGCNILVCLLFLSHCRTYAGREIKDGTLNKAKSHLRGPHDDILL